MVKKSHGNDAKKKKTITYKLKFIDSFRFMPTSLSELVDNTSGIFNSIEYKSCIETCVLINMNFILYILYLFLDNSKNRRSSW